MHPASHTDLGALGKGKGGESDHLYNMCACEPQLGVEDNGRSHVLHFQVPYTSYRMVI